MATHTDVKLETLWGEKVQDRRELLGLSQRQLAEILEPPTSQTTIWKLEHGKLAPRDDLKLRIAAALRTTPDRLFPWPKAA